VRAGTTRKLLVLALVVAATVLALPRAKVAVLAAMLLSEAAAPETDGFIARAIPDPIVEVVSYEVGDRTVVADLYHPSGGGPHPGIVLVHGMVDVGRNDERLMAFADALARAGYAALVPDFEGLRAFRASLDDVELIVGSYEYLAGTHWVRPDRVGLFGISYSGGLALLAAGDPRIADRVQFCFLLGAYHDLRNVVVYITTGYYRDAGEWVYLEPENFGRWVFLLNGDDLVDDPHDRDVLRAIALAKLDDPVRDVTREVGQLHAEGRRVFDLLTARDPDLAVRSLETLPPRLSRYLDALSPRGRMGLVRARLILAHGRDDNMIPYTESLAVAAEAGIGPDVHLEILDSFRHVDLRLERGRGLTHGATELARLYSVAWDVLAEGLL